MFTDIGFSFFMVTGVITALMMLIPCTAHAINIFLHDRLDVNVQSFYLQLIASLAWCFAGVYEDNYLVIILNAMVFMEASFVIMYGLTRHKFELFGRLIWHP